MVELHIASLDLAGIPSDCFVSVRVGETQKFSKLSAARTFKFPKAGDRRHGKVEVFRRIGACTLDVDPDNKDMRELSINCGGAGFGTLGLRIAVGGADPAAKTGEEPSEGKKDGKVKAAKEYLSKHGLEVRLSEAMQAVLREKPVDPAEFIAAKLLENTTRAGGVKLPAVKAPPREEANATMPRRVLFDTPVDEPQKPAARPQRLQPLPADAALAPRLLGQEAPAPPVLSPFKGFYNANFHGLNAAMLAKCYAKFPKQVQRQAAPAPPSVLPFKSFYAANFHGLNAAALAKCYAKFPRQVQKQAAPAPQEVLPFRSFYKANFHGLNAAKLAKCYSLFPVHRQATPAPPAVLPFRDFYAANFHGLNEAKLAKCYSLFPAHRQATPAPPAVLPFRDFYVANFHGLNEAKLAKCYSLFPARTRGQAAKAKVPSAAEFAKMPHMKPSVGTWLQAAPKPVKNAPAAEAPLATFNVRPSVGTWLVRRPPAPKAPGGAAAAEVSPGAFKAKPSVGTWLVRSPPALKV